MITGRLLPSRLLFILAFAGLIFFLGKDARATQGIYVNKMHFQPGEVIRVAFTGAPGSAGDWINIAPAGSPDTEAGDYQYVPVAVSQGTLFFTAPKYGRYEVRAYFNYRRNGYVVSARQPIEVGAPLQAPLPPPGPEMTPGYTQHRPAQWERPQGGIADAIPVTRHFQADHAALWNAVQDVLDEQGYFFTPDSSSGRIRTDPRPLELRSDVESSRAGFSSVVQIKVDGGDVSFKARFIRQDGQANCDELLEFPEKENELRRAFFIALDEKLRT